MTMGTKMPRYIKLIVKFLSKRVRSTGGWPPVADNDITELYKIMDSILKAKYGTDPDGDLPVQVIFVDRTKYRRMHWMPIANQSAKTVDGQMDLIERTDVNLGMAYQQHEVELKMLRHLRHRETGKA